jgi:lipoate-protein ligase A
VNKGLIENCKIYGDFFGVGEVSEIENKLNNKRYEKSELEKALADVDTTYYFGNVTKEEFLNLIY